MIIQFDATTYKYSAANAKLAALCAGLAYKSEDEIKETTSTGGDSWGFPQFHFFDRDETQGFMIGNDQIIVLAFRGTEQTKIRDWLTDLKFRQEPGPAGINVHRGFYKGLKSVWADVLDNLTEFRQNNQAVLLTGHSLGAALATLATAQLKVDKNITTSGLYTFGSPRVGGQDFEKYFSQHFQGRAFRFVNNNDAVTRFPPRVAFYKHVGEFLYFDNDGNMHQDIGFWREFKENIKGIAEDVGEIGLDMIKDHDMKVYKNYVSNSNNIVVS
ncbi:MAG: lipase family protein [Pseudanabaenaceae cyanobacterium]|jgi:triacylglycerol lipase